MLQKDLDRGTAELAYLKANPNSLPQQNQDRVDSFGTVTVEAEYEREQARTHEWPWWKPKQAHRTHTH